MQVERRIIAFGQVQLTSLFKLKMCLVSLSMWKALAMPQ